VAKGAAAIVAMGSCAAFGGIPKAKPNPTGAVSVADVIKDKPIINIPGCPPIPVVITGVLAHYLTFGSLPELDKYGARKRSTAKPSTTLLSPPVLRPGQVRQDLRRRGRAQRLVPVRTGLQGPGDLQRLCHHEVERRHLLAGGIRTWLPGLFEPDFWMPAVSTRPCRCRRIRSRWPPLPLRRALSQAWR